MRLFFLILSLSIGICAHSQNKQALSKSDSLFAKGVELYNQGNYKAAIPLFTESDKIDKAELDSTSNRREYSAMWLGSCYYKLGDEEKAKEISSIELISGWKYFLFSKNKWWTLCLFWQENGRTYSQKGIWE